MCVVFCFYFFWGVEGVLFSFWGGAVFLASSGPAIKFGNV